MNVFCGYDFMWSSIATSKLFRSFVYSAIAMSQQHWEAIALGLRHRNWTWESGKTTIRRLQGNDCTGTMRMALGFPHIKSGTKWLNNRHWLSLRPAVGNSTFDRFCDEVHVNTIKGLWSLLRSWLRPHRGISQEKLPLYLVIVEFVHNSRKRGKALLCSLLETLL